jgi:hypothetical protein
VHHLLRCQVRALNCARGSWSPPMEVSLGDVLAVTTPASAGALHVWKARRRCTQCGQESRRQGM